MPRKPGKLFGNGSEVGYFFSFFQKRKPVNFFYSFSPSLSFVIIRSPFLLLVLSLDSPSLFPVFAPHLGALSWCPVLVPRLGFLFLVPYLSSLSTEPCLETLTLLQ